MHTFAAPSRALAATIIATACLAGVPRATAAESVQQGSEIVVADSSTCAVAFNDRGEGVSYTSAHCGLSGERVRVKRADGSVSGEVGTFYPSSRWGESVTGNDWGAIRWDSGVRLGGNGRSGDSVASISDLAKGEQICTYGVASRQVLCGEYAGSIGNNLYWDGAAGQKGDSGGPVWSPRRGFLGVYSGVSVISSKSDGERQLSRASVPKNGDAVTTDDEIRLIAGYFSVPQVRDHTVQMPDDALSGAAAGSARRIEASSGAEEGTLPVIAVIVVGVLAASAPVIGQILQTVVQWRIDGVDPRSFFTTPR